MDEREEDGAEDADHQSAGPDQILLLQALSYVLLWAIPKAEAEHGQYDADGERARELGW